MQAGVHDTCERGGLESKQTGVSTRSRGAEACVGAAGGFTFAWGTFSVADDDVAHIGVRAGMSIPALRGRGSTSTMHPANFLVLGGDEFAGPNLMGSGPGGSKGVQATEHAPTCRFTDVNPLDATHP